MRTADVPKAKTSRTVRRSRARPRRKAKTRVEAPPSGIADGDLESRASQAHHESLRLWLRLLTCAQLIEGEVRMRLRRDFGITLPRFDLLAQLERHPEGLRMGELSRRMMVTSGNVTGITDQLVGEGLVRRVAPPDDRRAYLVRLTPAGKRTFDKMAAAHEAWMVELMGGLDGREREQLHALLAKVKQHVNGARMQT